MTTAERLDPRVTRTRAAVMETARELLVEGGLRALTIEAIVQRSGVARSTIYRHWPTRTDVVADALAGLLQPPPAPPPDDGPLTDRLRGVLVPIVARMGGTAHPGLIPALLSEADRDPELAGFRERFTSAFTAPVAAVLRDAVDRGELPTDTDVTEAVSQLLGPLMFHRFIVRDDTVDAGFAERMIDRFVRSRT